jgi:RNA polymerase sigma-70 factor (ECF subfamily)
MNTPADPPLEQLAAQAKAKDPAAIQALLVRIRPLIADAVRGVVSEALNGLVDLQEMTRDVTQEALFELWDALEQFDPAKGSGSFAAWATVVAKNAARDAVRFEQRERRDVHKLQATAPAEGQTSDWIAELAAQWSTPSSVVKRAEVVRRVREAIKLLRAIDREVITLCDLDGKTVGAAGEFLKLKPSTVAMRLQRARRNLVKIIGPESDFFTANS